MFLTINTLWCDGKRGNVQKEGCKFESHVWHVDKKFVSFNCVLYRVAILFFVVKKHMYCVTIDQVVTLFFDAKEHMSCVSIYQIVTLFWI